jgi:hypothetical protein
LLPKERGTKPGQFLPSPRCCIPQEGQEQGPSCSRTPVPSVLGHHAPRACYSWCGELHARKEEEVGWSKATRRTVMQIEVTVYNKHMKISYSKEFPWKTNKE